CILKKFITEIENLVDKKVKVIKCDNRTEFKNSVMNDFCAMKDHLGKFHGKADEGYFVRYSMNSKTFRVYNIRTRRVEENPHIEFLENKPIVAGVGPKWLFDIDMLIESMNYVPVIAGTNSDDFADGSQLFDSSPKLSDDAGSPFYGDAGKKHDEVSDKENDSEEEADFSNLESSIHVSPTPTSKTHKDYPLKQVIGSLNTPVQTRSKLKPTNEQGFISAMYKGKTHEDLNTGLFSCFISQIEPTRVAKALSDPAWGKKAIGTKWIFRNKKDKRGIMIKNKERLVARGYTQEEGIDYDEVFSHVARIEAIRLFLAYASFMGFMVYQMDVKSAFMYERIKKEVYVCQPPRFEDPDHPDKVYKVVKALYGLHQALRACKKEDEIFISQDKYVTEVLREFNFSDVKSSNTLVDTEKTLVKDADGDDVDV
nr:hypothetical protein [Tanacetum cinerariifolium]